MTAYAFQCQDCGHLVEGSAAGERTVPVNCPYCDIGSHLEWVDPDGFPAEQGQEFTVQTRVPAVKVESVMRPGVSMWFDPEGFPAKEGDVFTVSTVVPATPRQVIDRPNAFTVLADLSPKEQEEILRTRPDDTIERYGGPK